MYMLQYKGSPASPHISTVEQMEPCFLPLFLYTFEDHQPMMITVTNCATLQSMVAKLKTEYYLPV